MRENEITRHRLVSVVRFGIGKELQLYTDELVVTQQGEGKELIVPLNEIKRLILIPGNPNPSKLVLMADMDDDTTIILAEGMTNARAFREMLPYWRETQYRIATRSTRYGRTTAPGIEHTSHMVLTCYRAILLIFLFLLGLYLICYFDWFARTPLIKRHSYHELSENLLGYHP